MCINALSENGGGNRLVPHDSIHIDSWDHSSIKNRFMNFQFLITIHIVHTGHQTHQYFDTKTHQSVVCVVLTQ